MATVMACDMCQQEPGTVMQTNLGNGDVIVLGDNCQLAFYLTVIQSIIEAMPHDSVAEYAVALKPVIDAMTVTVSTAQTLADIDQESAGLGNDSPEPDGEPSPDV